MAADDAEIYRVEVDRETTELNPKRFLPGEPWLVKTGGMFHVYYGPYRTLAAARGQLTANAKGYDGEFRTGIVGARVQKAHTTWEVVE
ncbi:hypothetical protein AB0B69_31240 [Micromonospora parva]